MLDFIRVVSFLLLLLLFSFLQMPVGLAGPEQRLADSFFCAMLIHILFSSYLFTFVLCPLCPSSPLFLSLLALLYCSLVSFALFRFFLSILALFSLLFPLLSSPIFALSSMFLLFSVLLLLVLLSFKVEPLVVISWLYAI